MEIISKNYSHFVVRERGGGLDILFGRFFVLSPVDVEMLSFG